MGYGKPRQVAARRKMREHRPPNSKARVEKVGRARRRLGHSLFQKVECSFILFIFYIFIGIIRIEYIASCLIKNFKSKVLVKKFIFLTIMLHYLTSNYNSVAKI